MILAKQGGWDAGGLRSKASAITSLSSHRSLPKEQQALNVGQSNLFELDDLWAKFAERIPFCM